MEFEVTHFTQENITRTALKFGPFLVPPEMFMRITKTAQFVVGYIVMINNIVPHVVQCKSLVAHKG